MPRRIKSIPWGGVREERALRFRGARYRSSHVSSTGQDLAQVGKYNPAAGRTSSSVYRKIAKRSLGLRESEMKGKVVHHIDGNPRNNAKSNLMLMTRSDHLNLHREQGDLERIE